MPLRIRITIWLFSGLAIGASVGWISARVQETGVAPVGISSLVVGALVGTLIAVVANGLNVGHRSLLRLGAVSFIALTTIAVQHLEGYQESVRNVQQLRLSNPKVLFLDTELPTGLGQHFARTIQSNPRIVAWWGLDAVLILAATLIAFRFVGNSTTKSENDEA